MSIDVFERKALLGTAAALSVFLCSCGVSTAFYRDVEEDISQGRYTNAIQGVRANHKAYGDKSEVLYNLDMGLLYHYAGQPDSSNAYLFAAEKEIEDLYTKSVSLAAASMLLNDNVLPYEGEDFEKVLVNVFLALNYAEKGEPDEALVEARKVDLKLRQYTKRYEGKNKYQEDAFIRYIAGVLYETGGEINDAFISYRKAYDAYETYAKEYGTHAPRFLLNDLVRTATLLSFDEEAETYRSLGGAPYRGTGRDSASIVLVAYAGKGPIKAEVRPSVTIPDTSGTLHTFQIALPKFLPRYNGNRRYTMAVRPAGETREAVRTDSDVAENVTAIAAGTLEDRLSLIYLKSGGRALLKFLAAEKAKAELRKNDDKALNILGSLAVDLIVGATEQADVRSWRTLPAEVHLARVTLPPGKYTVSVTASDGRFTLPDETVTLRRGHASFVIVDDVR
jgi:hypothetical protein